MGKVYYMDEKINKIKNENQQSKLEKATIQNYEVAIKYYGQKKLNFLKYLNQKREKDDELTVKGISSAIKDVIIKQWNETVYGPILNSLNIDDYQAGYTYRIKDIELLNKIPISHKVREEIIQGAKSDSEHSNRNIYSLLGFKYEDYLIEMSKQLIEEQGQKGVAGILGQFTGTGTLTTKSAMRGEGLSIRPDLGVGFNQNSKTNGVLHAINNEKATVELQVEFNIEDFHSKKNNFTTLQEIYDIQKNTNMFGFSVKAWARSPAGKKITEMSGLKSKINQIYETQIKKAISPMYAVQITNKEVSNYIFNILGMVNVAFITGQRVIWTDEFLENYMLTMQVGSKNKYITKSGAIHPIIDSDAVYAQAYKMGRAIGARAAKQHISILSGAQYDATIARTPQVKFQVKHIKK